jgi:hypothetical protein
MNTSWKMLVRATIFILVSQGICNAQEQENAVIPSVLHIQHSVRTSQTGFPQFAYIHHVLDGAKLTAEARALTGTITLENHSPKICSQSAATAN